MQAAVIVFPGSNADRDLAVALSHATGRPTHMVWHRETELPPTDLIAIPGGFSYGDYLRSGAMAAQSPVMGAIRQAVARGVPTVGICNGFQILTEAGLLPGALMRNAGLTFVSRTVSMRVETSNSPFTRGYNAGQTVRIPIQHHDGCYFADPDTLKRLEDEDRVAFRYIADQDGRGNPNGSLNDIAGILSENRRVLGMMPHPERAAEPEHGNTDGRALFEGLVQILS